MSSRSSLSSVPGFHLRARAFVCAVSHAPLAIATGQVAASTLFLVPLAALMDAPCTLPVPSLAAWLALLGVAALSTAVAYVIYFRLLAAAGATNLLLVTFLIPVSAIGMGVLVLGEQLAPRHFAGLLLIGLDSPASTAGSSFAAAIAKALKRLALRVF